MQPPFVIVVFFNGKVNKKSKYVIHYIYDKILPKIKKTNARLNYTWFKYVAKIYKKVFDFYYFHI